MKAGIVVPQGWISEYNGWEPRDAWNRTVELTTQAERLGFESVWLFDHFHTGPETTENLTFEAFTSLSHLGAVTERVLLGHLVLCAGFRNPALTAKMISSMDAHTNGRIALGVGAGWKADEWDAYGYEFPSVGVRMEMLKDQLEIARRMFGSPRSSYRGEHARIEGAINLPQPIQKPSIPIVVGGNGERVTWRLAAQYADELNVSGFTPEQLARAQPTITARCEEVGRETETLALSVHMWPEQMVEAGPPRVEWLARFRELGVSRVMTTLHGMVESDDVLEYFAADCASAGVELDD